MSNRFYNDNDCRYGFQRQEKDNEIKGVNSNSIITYLTAIYLIHLQLTMHFFYFLIHVGLCIENINFQQQTPSQGLGFVVEKNYIFEKTAL